MTIKINFDFTTGNEISYIEGCEKVSQNMDFETNVLNFFCFDCKAENVIVVNKNGEYIDRNMLLHYPMKYCDKQVRKEHNIHKMLLSNTFKWQTP